ncbi:MAG TPA: citrate synthase [Gammaproteobacteria bacterium]|jgi:citrate synthase|nr:citrate synthase [Gammaproteobacteria bacterium]
MTKNATLSYDGKNYELPVVIGTEAETAVDISQLRAKSGLITLDSGYANTGACQSKITFIDGEKGILRYRGYPVEELAERSSFVETAYLLIFGELPAAAQLAEFRRLLGHHEYIHEDMLHAFDGFPNNAPPMAILSAMINALGCFQPQFMQPEDSDHFMEPAARLMSKVRTIAAASYRKSIGRPVNYPRNELRYTANLLHMMFSRPHKLYEPDDVTVRALDQLLLLHADHEQNCSTSTVRMVGSSQANLYASVAAGVCALWGPLHGGANVAVMDMLSQLKDSGEKLDSFIARVKDKDGHERLMGFGHRVYKNFDPRAKIIKDACHALLNRLGINDPLLEIAMRLEEVALRDEYFIKRKLYPNVDYYSGIIMRALGIPTNMFTVMFAIGRLPGWIAHWREVRINSGQRIDRPRQVYTGATKRAYVPLDQRK